MVDDELQLLHLYELRQQLLQFESRHDVMMDGLSEKRGPVLPSGLALLLGIFEALGIDSMHYSTGALREGLLYDMLGRIEHEEVRDRTVQALQLRYHINKSRSDRVRKTAEELLDLVGVKKLKHRELAPFLGWAADLYQIGLSVSHTYFQKHGAYLIRYSDLPGFTNRQQAFLALLVSNHRRAFVHLDDDSALNYARKDYKILSICLRLALIIQRGYTESNVQVVRFEKVKGGFILELHKGWRDTNKLLATDIEQEIDYLAVAGINLEVV
jgi:exopolyphosphatase/guanosine-5'-triphosphate,3'-diphosphate pyrophosphatase